MQSYEKLSFARNFCQAILSALRAYSAYFT